MPSITGDWDNSPFPPDPPRPPKQPAVSVSVPPDPYPEHTKLHAVKDHSQAIGEFLDWLLSNGYHLYVGHEHGPACWKGNSSSRYLGCELKEGDHVPASATIEKLLATYFEVDLERLEREKVRMLDEQRKLNERHAARLVAGDGRDQ